MDVGGEFEEGLAWTGKVFEVLEWAGTTIVQFAGCHDTVGKQLKEFIISAVKERQQFKDLQGKHEALKQELEALQALVSCLEIKLAKRKEGERRLKRKLLFREQSFKRKLIKLADSVCVEGEIGDEFEEELEQDGRSTVVVSMAGSESSRTISDDEANADDGEQLILDKSISGSGESEVTQAENSTDGTSQRQKAGGHQVCGSEDVSTVTMENSTHSNPVPSNDIPSERNLQTKVVQKGVAVKLPSRLPTQSNNRPATRRNCSGRFIPTTTKPVPQLLGSQNEDVASHCDVSQEASSEGSTMVNSSQTFIHVSVDLQFLFKRITEGCLGSDRTKKCYAIQILRDDPRINRILPMLTRFVSEKMAECEREHNLKCLHRVWKIVKCLMSNQNLNLEPQHIIELRGIIVKFVIGPDLKEAEGSEGHDHWKLRESAAQLLGKACKNSESDNIDLKTRDVLKSVLENKDVSMGSLYGAVAAIGQLGGEVAKSDLLPNAGLVARRVQDCATMVEYSPEDRWNAERIKKLVVEILVPLLFSTRTPPDRLREYKQQFGVFGEVLQRSVITLRRQEKRIHQ